MASFSEFSLRILRSKFKLRGGRHHICNGDLQVPTSPAYSALRDPGSAGVWNGTQDSEKVQVSGRVSRLVLFRGEVGLETGGQGRAGGLTAQMTTRGHSDGHAGHLSRDDLSSTRAPSLRRQLGFSAHDFFRNLSRTCTHNPTLAHGARTISPLWMVSGRRGDSVTPGFRA